MKIVITTAVLQHYAPFWPPLWLLPSLARRSCLPGVGTRPTQTTAGLKKRR